MMIRGFFTTFLMKQRLGIFGFGKASLGLGLFFISINSDLSLYHNGKGNNFSLNTHIFHYYCCLRPVNWWPVVRCLRWGYRRQGYQVGNRWSSERKAELVRAFRVVKPEGSSPPKTAYQQGSHSHFTYSNKRKSQKHVTAILIKTDVFWRKNENFFWNEKRLRSAIFPLQRQTETRGITQAG